MRGSNTLPVYFPLPAGTRSLPLALGMIQSFARTFNGGTLDRKVYLVPLWRVLSLASVKRSDPGIWFFSDYLWTVRRNLEISQALKEVNPSNITVHGGPSVPKYPAQGEHFLRSHHHVDIASRGEGEVTCAELIDRISESCVEGGDWRSGLEEVAGISFLAGRDGEHELIRTPDRPRLRELDLLPSPYLDGTFDRWLAPDMRLATVETNRGCPYGCTFCDWGSATQQKIHRFELERVKEEISWVARNKIAILFIADANFGVFDRDVEIAEHVASVRRRYGYPHEVQVSYAKNGNDRIAEIVRIMVSAGVSTQGIISIQTADENTLRAVQRTNIRTENYKKLAQVFRAQELPISTDLMIGLPGSTVQSHKNDLQFFFDEDIPAKAYRTLLLPNSPMADPAYMKQHEICTDESDFVIATATASEEDIREVCRLVNLYELAEKATLLRYVLRFIQWELGVPALEFLHRLLQEITNRPDRFPDYLYELSSQRYLPAVFADPDAFYGSVWEFAHGVMELPVDTVAARTVFQLNAFVVPRRGGTYPLAVQSPYDFVGYFRDMTAPAPGEIRRLEPASSPFRFEVTDPHGYVQTDFERVELFTNALRYFELDWPGKSGVAPAQFHESGY